MRSETVTNMLAVIAAARDASVQGEHIARFGRKLFVAPKDAAALLEALVRVEIAGIEAEHMSRLLAAAPDDARMARENGQGRGGRLHRRARSAAREDFHESSGPDRQPRFVGHLGARRASAARLSGPGPGG